MKNLLSQDGELKLWPDFISQGEQSSIFSKIMSEANWQQPSLRLYGKLQKTPRLVAWYGEADYTYSGHTHKNAPLTPALSKLWPAVEATAGCSFNAVLLNLYRSGQDSMGWHADDEPELGANPIIASLSLGAQRKFKVRHNQSREVIDILLPSGSLLVMQGAMQEYWQHAIPRMAKVSAPRLNLTFRLIKKR